MKGGRVWAAGLGLAFLALLAVAASLPFGASVASHPPEYELLESFGPDGSEATSFTFAGSTAFDQQSDLVYVLDHETGSLYKFDSEGEPVNWGGSAAYISGHEISGLTLPSSLWGRQVAVDSDTHKVYATETTALRAFLPTGEPAEFSAGPGMGTNVIEGFTEIGGIATDVNGYIYASDNEAGVVKVFKPSGEKVAEISVANPSNLAVDLTGAVYVNREFSNVLKFNPSAPLPVTEATTYVAESEPVDPATSFSVAVDPVANELYITKTLVPAPGVWVYDEDGEFVSSFGLSGSEGELTVARGIAVAGDAISPRVYVANWANGPISQMRIFKRLPPPPPGPPEIEDLVAREVGDAAATIEARINPNSLATTYHFEYGLDECPSSTCISVPVSPADIGGGHDLVAVGHSLAGLVADTVYHYRVVAVNSAESVEKSGVFRTQGTGLGFRLIDRRAWEMVSPSNKRGALIPPGVSIGHVQAAADGGGLAYLTIGSIEDAPAGNRAEPLSAVAQRRDNGRWSSEDISSPNSHVYPPSIGQQSEYKLFTDDLTEALLEPRDGAGLSEEASERTPYWRQNSEPAVYRPLVTGKEPFANVPPGTKFGGGPNAAISEVGIRAATPSLDHVVLESSVALATGAPNGAVYKWFDGQLQPASVLPDAEGGEIARGLAGSGNRSTRNAISSDGVRVFWTSQSPHPQHLYVRDTVAGETARVDVVSGGSGAGPSDPYFQGASADGGVVFFTDSAQLTADASPSGADLYRCELPLAAPPTDCASLVNISAPLQGSGESSEVLGVVSALSEDGTKVYFVAKGVLDTEDNQAEEFAVSGEPNLYVWQEGEGVRFIATLSEGDKVNWGFSPTQGPRAAQLSAVSSPSGRYLAFMSERSLSGEGHLNAAWEPVQRVFRYDAVTDRFDCISCTPTGAAPEGAVLGVEDRDLIDPRAVWPGRVVAAVVPQSPVVTTGSLVSVYQTRAVHDNGRVYFNAIDALVPADSNGEWDVYQHEPTGTGDCTTDAATSATAGGCVSLISSGTADGPAGFFDASLGGDDVFFLTPARLSALDRDDETDIYDARVNGVVATLTPPAECLGEACQPPPVVPNDPTPAGSTFQGPGNPKPKPVKRCPKGKHKVKRNGEVRCVARKNRKNQNQKPRTGQDRRAAR